MDRRKLSAGILAGGKSSRMGRNKALIELNNERIIDTLSKEFSSLDKVIISSAEKGIYEDTGLFVVYDQNRDIGPIEGIRQILKASDSEFVFICAADMPFMKKEIAEYLAGYISSDNDCYVITSGDRIEPLCAIYSKAMLPVIEELISEGRYRLREILNRVRTKYIALENTCFDKKCVRNINTKEDLRDLFKPFVFCVSGYSNSGKTGLIVKLINEFISDGYSVSVLKHDGCDRYTDVSGSDTFLYSQTGAKCSAIFSDSRFSIHMKDKTDAEEMIVRIKGQEPPPDFIIIEGMKDSDYPRIVVQRKESDTRNMQGENKSIKDHGDKIICTVTDSISPKTDECPVFGHEDVKGIYLCLKKYFLTENVKI